MNFLRMGEVKLSDMILRPAKEKEIDETVLPFQISDVGILAQAHFCDNVKKAYLYVSVTYIAQVVCYMKSGYKIKMEAKCNPEEYRELERLYKGEN